LGAEFYRTTQYGREYVIGRNCSFLQGPKTASATVSRLAQALSDGVEVCETILNYRRDGTPFMNLLLIAPLYDNRGRVRYFIGCQIDISNLIDGGRGLDSFQRLLAQDRGESRFGDATHKSPLRALCDLSSQFNKEEMDIMRQRGNSVGESGRSGRSTPVRPGTSARRIIGMEELAERTMWPPSSLGHSGRLPGVYQNYLLVRPYPSLRITFTSAALRIPGMLQSKFLDRIGGPQSVRDGILEALTEGVGATAKISWLTHIGSAGDRESLQGKPRWIHCTPLLGSDEKVGVWMIGESTICSYKVDEVILKRFTVMIESETITGSLNTAIAARNISSPPPVDELPIMGMPSRQSSQRLKTQTSAPSTRLYAQYLRETRPDSERSTDRDTIQGRTAKFTEEGLLEGL
jgi:PAS domain